MDVSCGDHEFLPSSVDCVLPFKVDDDNVGLIGLDIVFLHFQSEYIQYQGVNTLGLLLDLTIFFSYVPLTLITESHEHVFDA